MEKLKKPINEGKVINIPNQNKADRGKIISQDKPKNPAPKPKPSK